MTSNETCSCGASVEISGPEETVARQLLTWRATHAHGEQRCPVCEGRGVVPMGFYGPQTGTNSPQCQRCKGVGTYRVAAKQPQQERVVKREYRLTWKGASDEPHERIDGGISDIIQQYQTLLTWEQTGAKPIKDVRLEFRDDSGPWRIDPRTVGGT